MKPVTLQARAVRTHAVRHQYERVLLRLADSSASFGYSANFLLNEKFELIRRFQSLAPSSTKQDQKK